MPECINAVRNQGQCGSCWAHAASEVFSDRVCIQSGGKIKEVYSPQHLVDCDLLEMACYGGFLTTPFLFYSLFGAQTDECYGPYVSGDTHKRSRYCFLKKWNCPVRRANILSLRWLITPNMIKAKLMAEGPVSTGFTVYDDFVKYKSGVYKHTSGEAKGGHAVKIVGWGKENGEEYWIAQNSWTTAWGEKGFFRIAFGQCEFDQNGVSINPIL